MAEERYLTETVKYYTEVFRLVWVSILAIGGGSIGLLLGERTSVRVILAIAGLSVVGLLLEIVRRLNRQIGGLLKKLREVKDA
jgi:hypothetical protein